MYRMIWRTPEVEGKEGLWVFTLWRRISVKEFDITRSLTVEEKYIENFED